MITFVNVFTVLSNKQQAASHAIERVYTEVVRQQRGFIGAKLLVSDDGIRVTAIAQWESEQDLAAMRQTQEFKDLHNQDFFNNIESNDGHVYSTYIDI